MKTPEPATETFYVARAGIMTGLYDSARCEHGWVGICIKEMQFGSNRKASSQINSSRSFRPLRPRSKTSHNRLNWPNPRAPLLSRCAACCGASSRLPVFSNLAVLIFRRVSEGSTSLLVVLIIAVRLYSCMAVQLYGYGGFVRLPWIGLSTVICSCSWGRLQGFHFAPTSSPCIATL